MFACIQLVNPSLDTSKGYINAGWYKAWGYAVNDKMIPKCSTTSAGGSTSFKCTCDNQGNPGTNNLAESNCRSFRYGAFQKPMIWGNRQNGNNYGTVTLYFARCSDALLVKKDYVVKSMTSPGAVVVNKDEPAAKNPVGGEWWDMPICKNIGIRQLGI